jgi:hypothetical protein
VHSVSPFLDEDDTAAAPCSSSGFLVNFDSSLPIFVPDMCDIVPLMLSCEPNHLERRYETSNQTNSKCSNCCSRRLALNLPMSVTEHGAFDNMMHKPGKVAPISMVAESLGQPKAV